MGALGPLAVLTLATLSACTSQNDAITQETGADGADLVPGDDASPDGHVGPDGGDANAPSAACLGARPTDLTVLFDRYFARRPTSGLGSCASAGCHADGAGALRFVDADELHAAVLGVASGSRPDLALVEPRAPERSVFYLRLLPDAGPSRMPLGGPYLDDAALAEVAGWICAGGPSPGEGPDASDLPDATPPDALPADAGSADGGLLCPEGTRACPPRGCIEDFECCNDADCSAPETCGGGGEAGLCGCSPRACLDACGQIADGCGGELDCGGCLAPSTCGGGAADNVCACRPLTCASLGLECGEVPDGCGAALDCGVCAAPGTCGGAGVEHVCGCTPSTCGGLGARCGELPDGCGGTLGCGVCAAPETCGGVDGTTSAAARPPTATPWGARAARFRTAAAALSNAESALRR